VSESILEKALLEAEQLEETMKSNAKEILSSTMKEEIHELVKESLNQDDYLKEQEEEEEVDVLDIEDDMEGEEPEMELAISDDMELDIEDETDDVELPELPPLDLTLASDEEVLKVFKAMGDEDGIIIQQDDDEIELTDNTTDAEYIIKLEESKKIKTMKKAVNENKTEVSEMEDMDNMDEMDDMEDDVVYEIELSEDDVIGTGDTGAEDEDGAPESEKALKKLDAEMDEGFDRKVWGGNEDDKSKTHKGDDYAEMDEAYDDVVVGGNKDDKSKTHSGEDYKTEMDEKWSGNADDYLRATDAEGVMKKTGVEGGGKYGRGGHYKGYKPKEVGEASRTLGFGRKSNGKHKPSGIRKAISNNRNLGESRIRKSYNLLKEEVETLKVKNSDYKKALTTFRDKLNEVGVFNSNLAYVTRLFTEHSTTKQEKINILKRFDGIDSLKGSKGLYKVIKEELTQEVAKPTKTISEAVEQKITKSPTSGGGKLLESKIYENPQFSRMKDLMSKL
jgi:hypothetical protein